MGTNSMQHTTAILEAIGRAAEHLGGIAWEEGIQEVLAKLAKATRVSRIYIYKNHENEDGKLLTSLCHEWSARGISSQIKDPNHQNSPYEKNGFERWIELLGQGEVIHGLVKTFPQTERRVLESNDTVSILVVPIFIGNEWWGFIGFDDCTQERKWLRAEIEALKAAANIFSAAIQRQRMAQLEQRLVQLATFDDLTGVPNRRALKEAMDHEHARALRTQRSYCLALIDFDRFKLINDTYGHAAGDHVLVSIVKVFREALRQGDWIGRWGGEEFLCFLPETESQSAMLIMERLRHRVEMAIVSIGSQRVEVSVSVGLASYCNPKDTLETVLARADAALYRAKIGGRNRVIAADRATLGVSSIASRVQSALRSGRLRAAYQPIVDLKKRKPVAEETLARILCDDGTILDAANFIDGASQIQLLHRIDHNMINGSLKRCQRRVMSGKFIYQFVNISADLLRHPDLVKDLLEGAKEQCVSMEKEHIREKPLVIEITEREFLGDIRQVRETLSPFLDFGLRLAIDDFGSGYSSFKYLAHLPVTFLKIEGELVNMAITEKSVRSIIHGIQKIADDLSLITVAEDVENEYTAKMLEEIGIDWAQGFYFGRPNLA